MRYTLHKNTSIPSFKPTQSYIKHDDTPRTTTMTSVANHHQFLTPGCSKKKTNNENAKKSRMGLGMKKREIYITSETPTSKNDQKTNDSNDGYSNTVRYNKAWRVYSCSKDVHEEYSQKR